MLVTRSDEVELGGGVDGLGSQRPGPFSAPRQWPNSPIRGLQISVRPGQGVLQTHYVSSSGSIRSP